MKLEPIHYIIGALVIGGGAYYWYTTKKAAGSLGGTSGTYKGHWWRLTEMEDRTWGYAVGIGEGEIPLTADSPFADAAAARTAAFNAIDQMTESFSGVPQAFPAADLSEYT